ncbi:hypothetical protein HJG43_05475 [Kineosporiaceae bacterium SCSIO 59966]|nr:hypothetical protein HJG43_05475 [Kineosporiaceae bacterium SCSIO 59966]
MAFGGACPGIPWRRRALPVNRDTLLVGAGVGGVGGTTAGIGGPPLAMLHSGASGPPIRATLAAFFVIGHLVSVGALAAASAVDVRALGTGALLLPAALVGAAIARVYAPTWTPAEWASPCWVAVVSAVVLLARTVA